MFGKMEKDLILCGSKLLKRKLRGKKDQEWRTLFEQSRATAIFRRNFMLKGCQWVDLDAFLILNSESNFSPKLDFSSPFRGMDAFVNRIIYVFFFSNLPELLSRSSRSKIWKNVSFFPYRRVELEENCFSN